MASETSPPGGSAASHVPTYVGAHAANSLPLIITIASAGQAVCVRASYGWGTALFLSMVKPLPVIVSV